ncbi:MAG: hypothetical protein ISR91_05815 [Candidatus Delongbacteria bacterium]|nr:hypothetical protein [Candidatus Delongbacteria bacterium]
MIQYGNSLMLAVPRSCRVLVLLLLLLVVSCSRIPTQAVNSAPTIQNPIQASTTPIHPGQTITFTISVDDPDNDSLSSSWQASCGTILSSSVDSARWQAPDSTQPVRIICLVSDPAGATAADTGWFANENRNPIISQWRTMSPILLNGNSAWYAVTAGDPDSQTVHYNWEISGGSVLAAAGDSMQWQAPDSVTHAWIAVAVTDEWGGEAGDTLQVEVYRELGCAWICSQGEGEVVKLSSLGAELLRIQRFTEPVALTVDAENRRVWVADREAQLLWRLNLDGAVLDSLSTSGRPVAVAAVTQDGSCWVADGDSSLVRRIAADGTTILNTIRGLIQPTALVVNPWTAELWICDRGARVLYRVDADLPLETTVNDTALVKSMSGFTLPVGLAVEPESGACWLADRGADIVYRVAADLSDSLAVGGFSDPLAVAVTSATGVAWVSDGGDSGTISKLFYDNLQLQITGLNWPRALAVDFNDGSCWVPETEQNRVLRYSASGELLTTTSGFNYPVAISLNRGF